MTEREELVEEQAKVLCEVEGLYTWEEVSDTIKHTCRCVVATVLETEISSLRLAIVKKKPQLPENPYHERRGFAAQESAYEEAQQDMLKVGFVQKEEASGYDGGL